jgi:hypothetical protein
VAIFGKSEVEAGCRWRVSRLTIEPPLEGALSLEHGFMPERPTSPTLPDSHGPWDELAADLPGLFLSNRAQSVLERLPRLSAAPEALPDAALTRAAVILSALAHAYWRFGPERFFPQRITQVSTALPPSILHPWREVSRRLGRHEPERPFQSFYDLFLSNYRLGDGAPADAPRTIENMEVLVSSFRNEAERVFYMSFVEMHYHLTPMVGAICEIEDAMAVDDLSAIVRSLARIEAGLGKATSVWGKISARPGSRVFCDPVLWSKTAAILGVPPEGTAQGATSGACSPMLYVMDALLSRETYSSHYGRFMVDHARNFVASSVRAFSDSVRRLSLVAYVDARRDSSEGRALCEALDGVVAAYCGDHGWLGRHAAKVFNYLCISTIVGRNASVSGHERYFGRQTWVEASTELHESRSERNPTSARCPVTHTRTSGCPAGGDVGGGPALDSRARDESAARLQQARERVAASATALAAQLPEYTLLDVARRHDDTLWLAIGGFVYDVSPFLTKHPGGVAILQAYAGQDVTEVFWGLTVHRSPAVAAILERLLIGRLRPADTMTVDPALYAALAMLIRCLQSSRMQYEHAMEGALGLKLWSDENAHMLLLEENLPEAFELVVPGSFAEIADGEQARRVRDRAQWLSSQLDFSQPLSPELVERARKRCQTLQDLDLRLTRRLIDLTLGAIATSTVVSPEVRGATVITEQRRGLALAMQHELLAYFAAW